ncbi:MAG TPA: hypothetical protein VEI97_06140, partial [bacterium]|nr:hypothetical protein [bacterium]
MPATKTLTDNRNNTLVRVNHTDHRIAEPQGEIFYVCSSHADADDIAGAGLRPDYPFATIEYAVNQCTAGNQDVIYVLPGHTETVSEAGGLDFDKAGMTVIGVGTGDQRPLINFTTSTAADADVDADDITLVNLLFQCSIDGQLIMLDVNKADARILNCEFKEGTSAQPVDVVDITGSGANQCDRVKIQGCRFYFPTAGPA